MEDDIITLLHQNGVAHVVEEIFSYLDYSDIKSATQVSRSWRYHVSSHRQVWKNLWDRNIANLPAWNSLYKRAICLQTIPEWNHQEACRVVGDDYQKLLRNLQQGRCTETVDTTGKSLIFEVGSTKVVRAGYSNEIHVQNRWNLNEEAKSFDVTGSAAVAIQQFELNEPYLIAVEFTYPPSSSSVIVFDLEKGKRIQKFNIKNTMDDMSLTCVNVKCNNQILITCSAFQREWVASEWGPFSATLITARQMPCDAHPETDFPVIEQLKIPDFNDNFSTTFLEDQRLVIFKRARTGAFIISIKPLRIIREWEMESASKYVFKKDLAEMNVTNYWNGWLLHNERNICIRNDFQRIRLTNIDTGQVILHHAKHRGFDIANNNLVILSPITHDGVWKFDVWNLPQSNGFKELNLLYSFQQQYKIHPIFLTCYEWTIRFDGVQFWACLYNKSTNICNNTIVVVKDFTS